MRAGWKVCCLLLFSSALHAEASFSTLSKEANEARDANRLDRAAGLYRQALALRPSWAEGWFSLGTIQYDRSSYQSAALSFGKAAKLAPKQGTAFVMLGLSEFELGRESEAFKHLTEGQRIGISDPQLHDVALFHEGVLLQRAGQFDKARRTFYALCLAGTESKALLEALGLAALLMRDKAASAPVISKVGHAEWLAGQQKFADARNEYRAVVEAYPAFPNIHYAYGRFLLDVRDPAPAVSEFEAEIKNQPNHALARLQIAAVRYRVDSAAGLPYAEAAVRIEPALPLGHYLLGLLLLNTGDDKGALPELEIARKLLPREPGVYYALGTAYTHVGRMRDAAQARAVFQRLRNEPASSLLPQP
jgi:tetratricopeptide (TPR) repeat protein